MAMRTGLQWVIEDAPGHMRVADGGRMVNLYPEILPPTSKQGPAPVVLYGTPGLATLTNVPTAPIRVLHVFQNDVLVVTSSRVYRLRADGSLTQIGTVVLEPGANVSITDNGIDAVLVDGVRGYRINYSRVEEITDGAFYPSNRVTYQDGYFIFNRANTSQFFLSRIFDTTFDALMFASAEAVPDDLIAVFSLRQTLWLFGPRSIEFWYNAGDPDFPFNRIQGAFASQGLGAPASIAAMDNSLIWLGGDRIIYRAEGYMPVRISSHAIENLIRDGEVGDAHAYTYTERGHAFYVITFPSLRLTVAYDASTGVWHERRNYDFGRQLPGTYVYAFGRHIVGDFQAGTLYTMSDDIRQDAGRPIVREAVSPPITADGSRMMMTRFELEMQGGIGLVMDQGSDPQAMLQWSDDNGHTWSREHWAKIGKLGEYTTRVAWRRMGWFRDRRIRIRISDPVPVSMMRAWMEFERAKP